MTAITRPPSRSFRSCELTHLPRVEIDLEKAGRQHGEYKAALKTLGCTLIELAEEPDLPDAIFVEDSAVVLDEVAIICRPGAESRRRETESVAESLADHRGLVHIQSPGTLDGGDVLALEKIVYVGLSLRTNTAGVEQLAQHVAPYSYQVVAVPVANCLHLKSGVTKASEDTLLTNPDWVDPEVFSGWKLISVHPEEPFGANILVLPGGSIYSAQYERTAQMLAASGIDPILVDTTEIAKAEGGVTCCSLCFE